MGGSEKPIKKSLTLRIGEYIAGTTVEEVARRKYKNVLKEVPKEEPKQSPKAAPKKTSKRNLLKLEVTTDDEAEEDTLQLTYPRVGRLSLPANRKTPAPPPEPAPPVESDTESESASSTAAVLKRVRFETVTTPRKSALKKKKCKKTKSVSSSSDEGASSESEASSEVSTCSWSSNSSGSSAKARKKKDEKKKKEKSRRKSKTLTPETSSTDTDTDDKVECQCPKCIRKRVKQMKAKKKAEASDSEASQSEAEIPPKAKRPKSLAKETQSKRAKKKPAKPSSDSEAETTSSVPETETETDPESSTGPGTESEAETETESEQDKSPKKKPAKANKQQNKQAKQSNSGARKQAKAEKGKQEKTKAEEGKPEKANAEKQKDQKKEQKQKAPQASKKASYPEAAMLSPNARRPNFLEPIRAEVVQMERVIEGPKDPQPNAYYDAEHGVMRLYQGPVYGSRGSQTLYPRRDHRHRPLPIGVPHPTRNPYHHGFREQDASHVPYAQGTPIDPYHAAHAPTGYPPQSPPYGPPRPRYHEGYHEPRLEPRQKRPSYTMSGANGDAPSSSKRDVAGADNVGPSGPKLGVNNPYYDPPKSRFSTYVANKSGFGQPRKSGIEHQQSSANRPNMWDFAGTGEYPQRRSPGGRGREASRQGSQQGGGGWIDTSADNAPSNQGFDGAAANGNDAGSWGQMGGSNNNNNNSAAGDSWGQAPQGNDGNGASPNGKRSPPRGAASPEGDNVGGTMPGSWMPEGRYTENWGDATMAASTGGAVDQPGGEWNGGGSNPSW